MKRKRKTKHDHEAIIKSFESGMSDQEVSELHNCPLSTLRAIRRNKAGIIRKRKQLDYDAVVRDWKSGMTPEKVALKHRCTPQTVNRIVKDKGFSEHREHIANTATVNYLDDILKPMLQHTAVIEAIRLTEQRLHV
jgi:hypothetical protein